LFRIDNEKIADKEEIIEELKEEELMRRWHHCNFARRIRAMQREHVKGRHAFAVRANLDSIGFRQESGLQVLNVELIN
jgi:hypothetical protein